jgi:MFS family permease
MARSEAVVAAICAAGLGLVMTDNTAVTIALPSLDRDLGADVAGLQWVVATMVLATAAMLPLSGALGDRVGARRVYSSSMSAGAPYSG